MPANVRRLGHVYTREHNAFNATPLAVLNIARDRWRRRLLAGDAGVRGGRCRRLPDHRRAGSGIELFLEPGKEVLVARDGRDVAGHVAR